MNNPIWSLTDRQICDLELLLNGGFAPLKGFLGKADYNSVLEKMRMADGSFWPIPITLDVTKQFSTNIKIGIITGKTSSKDKKIIMSNWKKVI